MMARVKQTRPPFPSQLLEMSPDEYEILLQSQGYSEHAIEKEMLKIEQLHKMYLPPRRKTVNDVPVKDTNDRAYKALERRLNKNKEESKE